MKKVEKFEKKYNSLMYNHLWLKQIVENLIAVLATIFSAGIFTFGLNTFIKPAVDSIDPMVSGGSSGLAQVLNLLFFTGRVSSSLNEITYIIFYACINIPLVILAFKGIGKRFGFYSMLNVGLVAIFSLLMELTDFTFFSELAVYVNNHSGMIGRAFFGGICTGASSAVAFKIDASAGGFDIVSYYYSLKKSTLTGKYNVIINGFIIGSYAIINVVTHNSDLITSFAGILFSCVYLISVMIVIDLINIRNKKAQIQIITTKKELPKLLIANIPHGATIVNAKGAFSDTDKFIVYLVLSTTEVKKAVNIIKQLDPNSFVNVTSLQQVYGNFHMKPIK